MRPRLFYAVESATDVRLVEGLAECFDLTLVTRRIGESTGVGQTPCVPVKMVCGPEQRIRFARLLAREIRKRRGETDVLMVQGYSLAALVANLMGRLAGLPTIMLVCSPTEAYYRLRRTADDASKLFRRRELAALTIVARLNALVGQRYVVLSEHLANVVRSHGTRLPVDVIPLYGVDGKRFSPGQEAKAVIRERLGLPPDCTLLFFSSRIAPEKDADTLLAAMRILADRGYEIRLLHRSDGYDEFTRRAATIGVEQMIIATDAVHPHRELPDSYRASDICVQASREEGLGFSVLEALACEVPVVAAAVGGLRETVIDGQTGWTYPVGHADALAACLEDALTHPDEARRRAGEGREMVLGHYERGLVFERFARLVAEL